MFENAELARLFSHKQQLLAQSESNRAQFAAALESLRGPGLMLERGVSFFHETRFLWMLAAPLAGFFAVKKPRSIGKLATMLISGLQLGRTVLAFWHGLKQAGGQEKDR